MLPKLSGNEMPLVKYLECLEHASSLISTMLESLIQLNFAPLALACNMYLLN